MGLLYFKDLHSLGQKMRPVWQYKLGYEKLTVSFWINIFLTKSGEYTWEMGVFKNDVKTNKAPFKMEVPSISRNTNFAIIPDDMVSYVFGIGSGSIAKHKEYIKKLTNCYEETHDEAIGAILGVLPEIIPDAIDKFKLNPHNRSETNKRVIFYYCGKRVAGFPKVKNYWQKHFLSQLTLSSGQCAVTGRTSSELITGVVPIKLKNIAQSLPTGSGICTFNSDSFFAYSWNGGENAPIRAKTVIESYAFLNFLLQDERFHKNLSNGSLLYWSPSVTIHQNLWYSDIDFDELTKAFASNEADNYSKAQAIAKYHFLQGVTKEINQWTEKDLPIEEVDIALLFLKGNIGRSAIIFFESVKCGVLLENITRYIKSHLDAQSLWFYNPFSLSKTLNLGIPEINLIKSVLFGDPLPDTVLLNIIENVTINQGGVSFKVLLVLYFYLALKGKTVENMNTKEKYAFLEGQKFWLSAKMEMIKQNKAYRTTDAAWRYRYILNNDIQLQERLTAKAQDIYTEINYASIISEKMQYALSKVTENYVNTVDSIHELNVSSDSPRSLLEKTWFILGSVFAKNQYYLDAAIPRPQEINDLLTD
jgi:hypothetical protein